MEEGGPEEWRRNGRPAGGGGGGFGGGFGGAAFGAAAPSSADPFAQAQAGGIDFSGRAKAKGKSKK